MKSPLRDAVFPKMFYAEAIRVPYCVAHGFVRFLKRFLKTCQISKGIGVEYNGWDKDNINNLPYLKEKAMVPQKATCMKFAKTCLAAALALGAATTAEAMEQIKGKDYAGKYALSGKRINLIGVSFSAEKRTIVEELVEEMCPESASSRFSEK